MKFLFPLLAILLSVFAVAPLEHPGPFQSQAGLTATYNLIDLDQQPLQFFDWAPTVGHTFDLFRIDGALPYVAAELFHLVGLSYLDAIKLIYALAWIASGLTMFALARQFVGEAGALLASTVYVYLPFHIATVYVRGAFGESVVWALVPIALLAVVHREPPNTTRRQLALSILPFALLFLVQPGLAILFGPIAFGIAIALYWRQRDWKPALVSIGGGLAAGFLLYVPTILRHGAVVDGNGLHANYVLPFQLFSSMWGTGPSTGSFLDQFPLQIGVVPIGLAIIAVALAARAARNHASSNSDLKTRLLYVTLAAAFVVVVMTMEITALLWGLLGLFASYPWQLLTFAGLALALAAATTLEFDSNLAQPAMLAVFVGFTVAASYGYLTPSFMDNNPSRAQIAVFGNDEIALWDYRIVGPLRHGATVRIYLTWQALREVDHDYTVFVHAVDQDGKTWASEDSMPVDGSLPTIKWTPGQVISDTHTIQINVDGPREGYHLELGLYQAASGARAVVNNSADQLILPRPGDPPPTISDQLEPSQN